MQISHSALNSKITGVILAGGESQRMGCDKATLKIGTKTLYQRVESTMRSLFSKVVIAGDRPDLAADDITSHEDHYPGSSLGGLHTALKATGTEWVCIVPCDIPYPSSELLKTLTGSTGDYQAVVPRHGDGTEPLIACYRVDCLPVIEAQLREGDFRLTNLLKKINVRYLEPPALPHGWRRALLNLNTPVDLARLTQAPPAVTFVASSGTGKTTLLVKVIDELVARGWVIGALKHDAHRFEIDHEGKDSWRMTQAGASVTTISSEIKSATVRKHQQEPSVEDILLRDFLDVDVVLTEGFKKSQLPKIEIHRRELGRKLLCRGEKHDSSLIAIASNTEHDVDVPVFDLNRPGELADFIERHFLS